MMKKFRFLLEAVERVRRAKEQDTLRALAYAQAKYQETLRAKYRLLEETEASLARREKLAGTAQPVLAYQLESEFITGNKQRIVQSDQAITRARKFVEKALREVILAKRALKGIELLREKAFLEFKTALRKKESKDLEEVYVSRHGHPTGLNETDETEMTPDWSESA
jgi:flagellar export protein FliJ